LKDLHIMFIYISDSDTFVYKLDIGNKIDEGKGSLI